MFGTHHSVVHRVIYVVYHLLQAQFFQQHFVVQNSQDHSLGEVSGTQYTGKKNLVVTEVFATVLVYKVQGNKTNIMQCTAVQSVQLSSYNILTAKELLEGSCKSTHEVTTFFSKKTENTVFCFLIPTKCEQVKINDRRHASG